MRSKAPLLLMEQMVMLLVFALAAALCVQAFVKSDAVSARGEARDNAVIAAQTAAETIRLAGGSPEEALAAAASVLPDAEFTDGTLRQCLDGEWSAVPAASSDAEYTLAAQPLPEEQPGLSKAEIAVASREETLFTIEVAWQSPLDSGN